MIIFGLINPSFISLFLAFISGHFISTMAFLKKSLMKIKPSKNIQIFKVAKKLKNFLFLIHQWFLQIHYQTSFQFFS